MPDIPLYMEPASEDPVWIADAINHFVRLAPKFRKNSRRRPRVLAVAGPGLYSIELLLRSMDVISVDASENQVVLNRLLRACFVGLSRKKCQELLLHRENRPQNIEKYSKLVEPFVLDKDQNKIQSFLLHYNCPKENLHWLYDDREYGKLQYACKHGKWKIKQGKLPDLIPEYQDLDAIYFSNVREWLINEERYNGKINKTYSLKIDDKLFEKIDPPLDKNGVLWVSNVLFLYPKQKMMNFTYIAHPIIDRLPWDEKYFILTFFENSGNLYKGQILVKNGLDYIKSLGNSCPVH